MISPEYPIQVCRKYGPMMPSVSVSACRVPGPPHFNLLDL